MEIYHITHISNLSSILEAGGLLANSQLKPNQYTDIAHSSIQDRRASIQVPWVPGGTLHDYVPFYFAPRSPMLYAINKGNVQGYQGGQNPILHLAVELDLIMNCGLDYVFTDGHAIMTYSEFYKDLGALNHAIDWALMNSNYWFDTEKYPDRKRRRQAEFLVHQFCPWNCVAQIGVIDATIQNQVRNLLRQYSDPTPVKVYRNWYY